MKKPRKTLIIDIAKTFSQLLVIDSRAKYSLYGAFAVTGPTRLRLKGTHVITVVQRCVLFTRCNTVGTMILCSGATKNMYMRPNRL